MYKFKLKLNEKSLILLTKQNSNELKLYLHFTTDRSITYKLTYNDYNKKSQQIGS